MNKKTTFMCSICNFSGTKKEVESHEKECLLRKAKREQVIAFEKEKKKIRLCEFKKEIMLNRKVLILICAGFIKEASLIANDISDSKDNYFSYTEIESIIYEINDELK